MKGSLVRLRLLAIPNNEKLSFDEDVEDKKEWVIAHCWGVSILPNDTFHDAESNRFFK